ncbi:MAG: hypothetical protein IT337_04245 [Thermomicrobiales bacterium]|nr:hypothetical protein [Thermomicrobiales bacterium]
MNQPAMLDAAISRPRAMFYCHDTYGLGHLRRTLTLAHHFRTMQPDLSQLIVSGSPVATAFAYPEGADVIKLPSVTKAASGAYQPRTLGHVSFDSVRDMRRDLILAAARQFRPHLFFVDHAPGGLRGEAVETLRRLKEESPSVQLVLGLRDVMDDAPVVREAWAREGAYELFDEVYDTIFVYGHRAFYDVVAEYGLSDIAAAKTRFVGYLRRDAGQRTREEIRASLGLRTDKLVLVTAGGGGDGRTLFEAMIRDLRLTRPRDFDCLIVGGPLLSGADRDDLRARLGDQDNFHYLDFTDDMPGHIGAADAVIGMGGYNTVCETLSLRCPTTIVPRVSPRKEQLIRASFLNRYGYVDMIHPHELAPRSLVKAAARMLEQCALPAPELPMQGLTNIATALRETAAQGNLARVA